MGYRGNIIKNVVEFKKFNSYLELGLRDPNSVFNHIPCPVKHSVDIGVDTCTYKMSTDDFFSKLKLGELNISKDFKWDAIFIDANHLCDFVKNDVLNSLNHLNDKGIIFLHDILPPSYDSQLEDRRCQTAWKAIPYFLKNHPELHLCSIPEVDGGIGVLIKNPSKKRPLLNNSFNMFYEYYIMNSNRKISQNLIEENNIFNWLEEPYYNYNSTDVQDISPYTDMSEEGLSKIINLWQG